MYTDEVRVGLSLRSDVIKMGASSNPARGNFFTKLSLGSVRISCSIFLVKNGYIWIKINFSFV